ncbi:MAG: hypothetical protein OCD03_14255 [Hyphomicrobiales bacterium]
MKSPNHLILDFFLSSYRLNDMRERADLVTDNFSFTTPVAGKLNFQEFHHYNSIMRNHTEHEVVEIVEIDEDTFEVDVINTVVENEEKYNKKVHVKLSVKFVNNLVESLNVEYIETDHDNKIFKKILSPILEQKK